MHVCVWLHVCVCVRWTVGTCMRVCYDIFKTGCAACCYQKSARGNTQVHGMNDARAFSAGQGIGFNEPTLFFLSIKHTHTHICTHTQTLRTWSEWRVHHARPMSLVHTHTHTLTHTLTIQPLFGNATFSALKGVPRVCVSVCVFFLDVHYWRAFPYLVFPKAQLTEERAAIWPLSLSLSLSLCLFPSFAPLRDFYSFMYLSSAANYHFCQGTCTDVHSNTHTRLYFYTCKDLHWHDAFLGPQNKR